MTPIEKSAEIIIIKTIFTMQEHSIYMLFKYDAICKLIRQNQHLNIDDKDIIDIDNLTSF